MTFSPEDWIDGEPSDLNEQSISLESGDDSAMAERLVIHSLLTGHFESTQSREARIRSAMDAFDQWSSANPVRPASRSRRNWMFVASTAATVLLALGLWGMLTPQSAQASLERVIAATQVPVTRVYQASIHRRFLGRDSVRKATLFSRSIDQFAAKFHDTKLTQSLWIGSDGAQRWLVAGNHQWSSTDDAELPRDAFIDRVTYRNMQFNALLTRIPRAFDVRLMPREIISIDGQSHDCRPIEATPRNPESGLPDFIRIWPHPSSGVVLQMHLINDDARRLSVRRIELQWSGEQEVSEDFFSLDFHQS